jgi:hypothetical protein
MTGLVITNAEIPRFDTRVLVASSYFARGRVVVQALCYKPEGRGFDTRWGDF